MHTCLMTIKLTLNNAMLTRHVHLQDPSHGVSCEESASGWEIAKCDSILGRWWQRRYAHDGTCMSALEHTHKIGFRARFVRRTHRKGMPLVPR